MLSFIIDERGRKMYYHSRDGQFDATKYAFHLLSLHVPPRDVYWRLLRLPRLHHRLNRNRMWAATKCFDCSVCRCSFSLADVRKMRFQKYSHHICRFFQMTSCVHHTKDATPAVRSILKLSSILSTLW